MYVLFYSHLIIFRRYRSWQSQDTSMQESSFCFSHVHHRSLQPERIFQWHQVNLIRQIFMLPCSRSRFFPQCLIFKVFSSRSFLEENNFSPHRCDVITQQFEASSLFIQYFPNYRASFFARSLFQEHKEDVRILLSRFAYHNSLSESLSQHWC